MSDLAHTRPRWGLAAAAYAYLITVALATFVIARSRATAGIEPRADEILLWQAASYGLWLPVAAAAWLIFKHEPTGKRAMILLATLGLGAVFGHAIAAAALENAFAVTPPASILEGAGSRLPIDLLVCTAIFTATWAIGAHARSADLAEALATARSAAGGVPPPSEDESLNRLLVSVGSRHQPVEALAIEWIGAAGNYAVIHWAGGEGLVRETLKILEQRLNPDVFVRVHRSSIANLAMVDSASSLSDGSWRLVMKSGDELVVSRTYRDAILARLGRRAA